ncbi:hypothetical protein NDU88_004132 [Pleurodeles waltl]|uniref:Secreted protein n=1 Tax=Pleurodeles waltl TaxID=8319 RepID=A0AAV7MTZ6_PLEWA|nr:hypothetical protein NDU88_004132 [Pleurodeles waltl]
MWGLSQIGRVVGCACFGLLSFPRRAASSHRESWQCCSVPCVNCAPRADRRASPFFQRPETDRGTGSQRSWTPDPRWFHCIRLRGTRRATCAREEIHKLRPEAESQKSPKPLGCTPALNGYCSCRRFRDNMCS